MEDLFDNQNKKENVGYKRPPREHQFKPGISGNPYGRPTRKKDPVIIEDSQDLRRTFLKLANSKVKVGNNGVFVERTALEAILQQMINSALKGDLKTIKTVLDFAEASYKIEDEIHHKYIVMCEDLMDARERALEESEFAREKERARLYRQNGAQVKKKPDHEPCDQYQPRNEDEWAAYRKCLDDLKNDDDAETWQSRIVKLRAS